MSKEANLLVTFDPTHTGSAKAEVQAILESADEEAEFIESDVEGVFLMKAKSDAVSVVKKLIRECEMDPARFNYTFHWLPIQRWCSSDIDEMSDAIKELESDIGEDESWKMELNKRFYNAMHTTDLIMKLTDSISRQNVNLKNPDKVIHVEIIKDRAGISLLSQNEMLDVPKLKASE